MVNHRLTIDDSNDEEGDEASEEEGESEDELGDYDSGGAYWGFGEPIWRAVQGDYVRGLRTRVRRLRGVYDDTDPSDLVEYHVVRQGVDEEAIRTLLADRFGSVEIFRYWASQAPVFQRLGDRSRLVTDFGVEATGRR